MIGSPEPDDFRFYFEQSPIATWVEDFTLVGDWLAGLRMKGVVDLRRHLDEHPHLLREALCLVRVVRVNRAAVVQCAARDEAHLLASLASLFSDHSYRTFAEELVGVWNGQSQIEHEFHSLKLDGTRLDVIVRIAIPERDGRLDLSRALVTSTDISTRRQAEEVLRESQQTLAAIAATMPHTMYVYDIVDRRTLYMNRAIWLDLGYTPEEGAAFGSNLMEKLLHPNDLTRFGELVARWDTASDGDVLEVEYRMRAKSGEWRWYLGRDTVYSRDSEGRVRQVIGTAEDMTERKQAALALRESEAFLRLSQRVGRMGSWEWDIRTNRVHWSEGMLVLHGLRPEEFDGTLEASLRPVHPDDREALAESVSGVTLGGEGKPLEYRIQRPDGTTVHLWASGELTRDADGSPVKMTGTVVDVTERRLLEEERRKLELQIQHAQKLESLGVLTGGIAHDFNNLLTGILGYANLARMTLPVDSEAAGMLREIERGGERAAELTQQMLAYAGKGRIVIQPVRLDRLVQEMAKLLKTVVSKKAEVELILDPAAANGDPAQLRQVAMNLITNASDALADHVGRIVIRTGTRMADDADQTSPFFPEPLPPGLYSFIEVEDTGQGMNDETVKRIFDPFFTTKFTGRGLGLAATLGIVRTHRGIIHVHSALGRGTRFEVLIPAIPPHVEESGAIAHPLPRGRGAVLVVDDEPSVRGYAKRVLESGGYRTRLAANGAVALQELDADPAIDVLLLDLTMPVMDGAETLHALRDRGLRIPVLVMSGYSEHDVETQLNGLGISGAIQKPFLAHDLLERLAAILASR